MKGNTRKWIVEALFLIFAILLIIYSYKTYIFQCAPWDVERMLGYFHFVKKVVIQYKSFPHFLLGFSPISYPPGYFFTYEYFSMPETPLLTPFIFLYFLRDILISEKISLALHLIIGVLGIYVLGKHFKISKIGTLLWLFLFFLSDNLVSQYSSGHLNWKTVYLFPWVFYFYIKSFQNKRFIFLAVFSNLLIFFEGGTHIFIWCNLFIALYGIFSFLDSRRIKHLLNLAELFIFTFLTGSIKIIPMLHFFGDYKPSEGTSDLKLGVNPPYSLNDFFTALTTPNWGAEYANYIGIPLIILFFFAIIFGLKANRAVLFTSLFFLLLTLKFDGFSLFYIARKFPVLSTQRVPPRFFVMALFALGLLSSLLLTHFQQKMKNSKTGFIIFHIFMVFFTFYIYLDLSRVCSLLSKKCRLMKFPDTPVYFRFNPVLIPEGRCTQKLALPNLRKWKLRLNNDSMAVFDGLEWKKYKNVIKFGIYRNERFEKINPQPYNDVLSVFIPKDTYILEMRYCSPYFMAGLLISVFSLILIAFLYLKWY